jgi:hypothetical protein
MPLHPVGWHGGTLHQNGWEAPKKRSSHHTRGIGTQDYTSPSLHTGHPLTTLRAWHRLPECLRENSDCPATCCLRHPRQGMTDNRSRCKFSGPSTWHPQLSLPTPESGQWLDEDSLWQTGQLRKLPRGWQSVALSPKLQSSWEGPYKVVTQINYVITGSRGTLGQGWWWYTWTDWNLIRELLKMRDLKEGAAGAVGE